ncbi:MAG TPA: 16S rRNA (adenine(1518)-N(6)/adenine(1519)-N(6))-dimethyltransferase RsmA [Methylomirabilota bacterium]|nr:16S rRNA (adenine(1518)-N(6)/adenine(1519)-N(6))-dimethyltransferase RsmA [Methylomirabilota bacterium]
MVTLLQQTRFALGELGIRPHKRFGQHFLISAAVVEKMITAAQVAAGDVILEIGPGLGALSVPLAERAAKLYLVEIDALLAERLQQRFAADNHAHVIVADFLTLNLASTFREPTIHVVASLPYNVATPILFRLLEHRRQFPEATVMMQKEVAERLTAEPGTKAYGVPSVFTQLYATVSTVCTVGPGSFFPAPQVESQVIRLVFQPSPRAPVRNEKVFQQVVKAAFAQRRKTLRNALKAAGYDDIKGIERRAGVDFQRRGETLSVDEFAVLANVLANEEFPRSSQEDKLLCR